MGKKTIQINSATKSHTCKDIFTDVNYTRSLANTTSCYVENSIKHIRMTIMHTHPVHGLQCQFHAWIIKIQGRWQILWYHYNVLTSKDLQEHAGLKLQSLFPDWTWMTLKKRHCTKYKWPFKTNETSCSFQIRVQGYNLNIPSCEYMFPDTKNCSITYTMITMEFF